MTYFDPDTVLGATDSKLNNTDIILAYRTKIDLSLPSRDIQGRVRDRN